MESVVNRVNDAWKLAKDGNFLGAMQMYSAAVNCARENGISFNDPEFLADAGVSHSKLEDLIDAILAYAVGMGLCSEWDAKRFDEGISHAIKSLAEFSKNETLFKYWGKESGLPSKGELKEILEVISEVRTDVMVSDDEAQVTALLLIPFEMEVEEPNEVYDAASEAANIGNYKSARCLLEELLKEEKTELHLINYIFVLFFLKENEALVDAVEEFSELYPQSVARQMCDAMMLIIAKDPHCYRGAVSILESRPDYAENSLALLLKAYSLYKLCEWDDALSCINATIKLDSGLVEARLLKGRILLRANKYDGALREFNKAVDINPKCARAYKWRAKTLAGMFDYDAALVSCCTALEFAEGYEKERLEGIRDAIKKCFVGQNVFRNLGIATGAIQKKRRKKRKKARRNR